MGSKIKVITDDNKNITGDFAAINYHPGCEDAIWLFLDNCNSGFPQQGFNILKAVREIKTIRVPDEKPKEPTITLRDFFALEFMKIKTAIPGRHLNRVLREADAEWAYGEADTMIAKREKNHG